MSYRWGTLLGLIGTVEDREGGEGCEVCRIRRKGRRSRWWSRIQRTPEDQVEERHHSEPIDPIAAQETCRADIDAKCGDAAPMIVRASSSRALPRSTMRVQLARGRLLTSGIT
ncbi:uncharacterized protein [Aegilops tauschii subsp. strangulata]|uniref:uncharacterized protein isoform X1 n=1 Tax=Aegilops tauschii subsp. strangulata TaxID=200361 RepID=UPI003CC85984